MFLGMASSPFTARLSFVVVVVALIQLFLPISAVERPKAPHHTRHADHGHEHSAHMEVSLDKRGMPYMRREPEELMEAQPGHLHQHHRKRHPHHHHHRNSHQMKGEALLEDGPDTQPTASEQLINNKMEEEKLEKEDATPQTKEDSPTLHNLGEAEKVVSKVDQLTKNAEEKAGLPDSTKTTPEPQNEEPSDEEQEGNALMFAAIALIVLVGAAAAAWSIYIARRMQGKADDKSASRTEGDGEGEEAEGEATAEAEGEK